MKTSAQHFGLAVGP